MGISETLGDLTKSVADLYKEILTNTVRFEELRRQSTETLDDFKRALELLAHKIDMIQMEHVKHQAQITAEIQVLEGRLSNLSEQALHVVVREAAREVAREQLQGERKTSTNTTDLDWHNEEIVESSSKGYGGGSKKTLNPGPASDG